MDSHNYLRRRCYRIPLELENLKPPPKKNATHRPECEIIRISFTYESRLRPDAACSTFGIIGKEVETFMILSVSIRLVENEYVRSLKFLFPLIGTDFDRKKIIHQYGQRAAWSTREYMVL